ncbi:hypothetical protein F6B93_14655 [Mycobacterium spongiae]|uniref:Integrase catalytic domain-containing protein n=1 Tax=Mycobacterium spongiae TaxID=886343 RepID=A0A975PXJ3_9MYCO|nr:hypothetical protein F6B93_14655 [Mycobacterium spongiae]
MAATAVTLSRYAFSVAVIQRNANWSWPSRSICSLTWELLSACYATAEWVDWFNHRRLYEYCGDVAPADLENAYYHQTQPSHPVGSSEAK